METAQELHVCRGSYLKHISPGRFPTPMGIGIILLQKQHSHVIVMNLVAVVMWMQMYLSLVYVAPVILVKQTAIQIRSEL